MYEEYMQNMLGYMGNPYQNSYLPNMPYGYNSQSRSNYSNEDLEKLYPEVYNVVYPMVKTACDRNTRAITEDAINQMVEDIYNNIETNDRIELNINLENEVRGEKDESKENVENRESRSPRRPRNFLLRDLIRILLLRELIRRRDMGRPPMRPGRPGGRPPMMPRYDDFGNNMYYGTNIENDYLRY